MAGRYARFKGIMPVLRVAEMQSSIDWYTRVLGFELRWREPNDGGGENCMLQAGPTKLMLSTGTHLGDQPAFTGTLYFETEGVRDFYAGVKDSFGIHDPDGYTLAFAEPSGTKPDVR